mgnify:CR=1 FL=1
MIITDASFIYHSQHRGLHCVINKNEISQRLKTKQGNKNLSVRS